MVRFLSLNPGDVRHGRAEIGAGLGPILSPFVYHPSVDSALDEVGRLPPGEIVGGRFEVLEFAGAGGMAAVYRARDRATGELHALKLLRSGHPKQLERFEREARVLAQLRHPGIVRYVAHGHAEGRGLFIAMEWLEGLDLGKRLETGPLTVGEALRLVTQVSTALAVTHARGVVHRDVKPSNLFLTGGQVATTRILDFGVASLADDRTRITRTGELLGTPLYMAPEQWGGGDEVDARADVFALGGVLYECLTGHTPFRAAVAAAMSDSGPPPPSTRRAGIPAALDQLVLRMFARDRSKRPVDGRAVLNELLAFGRPEQESSLAELTSQESRVESVVVIGGCEPDVTAADVDTGPMSPRPARPRQTPSAPDRKILRALVERYRGRLVSLAGGTLLMVFAEPIVPTDRVVRAVRCALSVRGLLPDAPVSVVTGRDLSSEGARVGAAVRTGGTSAGVVVDEVTAGLLPGRFSVAYADNAFTVAAERDVDEAARLLLGRPAPFVGREGEMANLLSSFDECARSGASRAVVVTAVAGVGKSRLRLEFVQQLHEKERDCQIWLGRGDPLRMGSPFALIGDAVRRVVGIRTGDPLVTQLDKLHSRVSRTLAPDDARRVSAFLGEMIGVRSPDDRCEALLIARQDPAAMADGIRRAWEDWLRAECEATPVLLVLEDLHWGDASSVKLTEDILKHEQACLVLGLARPEIRDAFPSLLVREGTQEINLAKLSRKYSAALVQSVLGDGFDAAVVERVVELSAGHPFFLEELIRHVAEGRVEGLPETVLAMVQARLEGMEPDARRVLRTAAVFGEQFWTGGVLALVGSWMDRAQVEDWLSTLANREVIERRAHSRLRGEHEWMFRHALVRDAAYSMLTDADRTLAHRLAGGWMADAGEENHAALAQHFERGEDWDRAAQSLGRANEEAIGAEAMEEADRYFADAGRVIAKLPDTPDVLRRRVSLVLAQLPVVLTLLKFPSYYEVLLEHEPLAVKLGDDALLGTLQARLGESLWAFGKFDEAIARLERGAELCSRAGTHEEAGYAYQALMGSNAFRGNFEAALALRPRLEEHMAIAPNPRWHTYGLGIASMSLVWLGRWREAIAVADEALALAEASKQPGVISFAGWVLSFAHTYGGDADRAIAAAEHAIAAALTIGDRTWAECALATALCRADHPERTIEVLSEGLPLMRTAEFAAGEMFASVLVRAYTMLGRHDEAAVAAAEMLRVATQHKMQLNIGVAHRHLAEIALVRTPNDLELPARHLEASVATLTAIRAQDELAMADVEWARLHERAGRAEEARRSLTSAVEVFERLGSPWSPPDLAALRARITMS